MSLISDLSIMDFIHGDDELTKILHTKIEAALEQIDEAVIAKGLADGLARFAEGLDMYELDSITEAIDDGVARLVEDSIQNMTVQLTIGPKTIKKP